MTRNSHLTVQQTRSPGVQYTGGRGGNGLHDNVEDLRTMEPTSGVTYPSEKGYATYMNGSNQGVNPFTGRTLDNADPYRHWQFEI